MSKLVPFEFESKAVRVFDEDGEPWFVLADVCKVLGISNHRDAASRLDEDERGSVIVDTPGGRQETTTINESGLYSLILTSRKSKAKRFKKWVTGEVLPSIRKTGGYGLEDRLNDPAWLRSTLLDYSEKAMALQAQLDEQRPMVASYERIAMASDGSLCVTDAAKTLQMRPKDLFAWMNSNRWIYRRAGCAHWVAFQDKLKTGYLEHKVTEVTRSDGSQKITEQVRVTAKGLAKMGQLLGREADFSPPPLSADFGQHARQ